MYRKLEVRNRTEAVQRAQRLGVCWREPRRAVPSYGDASRRASWTPGLSEIARFLAPAAAVRRARARGARPRSRRRPRSSSICAGAVILSEDGGPVTFLRVIHSGGGRHRPRRPAARPARPRATRSATRRCCPGCRPASRRAPPRTRSATGSRSRSPARCSTARARPRAARRRQDRALPAGGAADPRADRACKPWRASARSSPSG